jgi:hypothetical protein
MASSSAAKGSDYQRSEAIKGGAGETLATIRRAMTLISA